MKVRSVVSVNPIKLPGSSGIRREAPRPPELRQADYNDRFDADTLVYDVFAAGDRIKLCGPPLLNLADSFEAARWFVDGIQVSANLNDLDRTQSSWLSGQTNNGDELMVITSALQLTAKVSPSYLKTFRNRRVLTTKSKNNDLQWISDWAKFHAIKHGVDAVLLYDNGSDRYTLDDLLAALDHPELDVVIVVDWPFKFGPQGGSWEGLKGAPWDSDFCEYGILEHARHRFLGEAAGVVSHDIDELVMTNNDQTIFEIIDGSKTGYIHYSGRWVESISRRPGSAPQFTDFVYYSTVRSPSTVKWAIDPKRAADAEQWKTHSIVGIPLAVQAENVKHRHFMGITTNWKWKRDKATKLDSKVHKRDSLLVKQLADVFGAESAGLLAEDLTILTATERAHKLELLLAPERRLNDGLQKVWYWKSTTLVLEYISVHGIRYAFDIIFREDSARLQVTARDDVAWYKLRKACGDYTKVVAGSPRSLQYVIWKDVDLEEIARDVIAHVQHTNAVLNHQATIPPRSIASYWWDMKKNFGDLISPWILEELTARPVYNTIGRIDVPDALMTVGSLITEMQRPGMTIWGTGLIAPLNAASIKRLKPREPEAILAVRGKHTRKQLMKELGWDVPEVYGDPALLMPYLFQPDRRRPTDRQGLSVILHYAHKSVLTHEHIEKFGGYAIEVQRPAEHVVAEIALSDVVISTSLHGLILAQAYEIPWVWLRITDNPLAGDKFKFEDFFTVLKRDQVAEVEVTAEELREIDLAEVARTATVPKSYFDPLALVKALPFPVREDMMQRFQPKLPWLRKILGSSKTCMERNYLR